MQKNTPKKWITHHAVSKREHTARDVGHWHYDRWGGYRPSRIHQDIKRYIGYHFIIEWDGTLVQCRALDEEGIHCKGQNFSSIGVCFMGNFDLHLPSDEQISTWKRLYREHGAGLPVYPHRRYAAKSCHGSLLPDSYFADAVQREYYESLIEKLSMLISRLQALLLNERMK